MLCTPRAAAQTPVSHECSRFSTSSHISPTRAVAVIRHEHNSLSSGVQLRIHRSDKPIRTRPAPGRRRTKPPGLGGQGIGRVSVVILVRLGLVTISYVSYRSSREIG